jgi:hypothetical protein
VPLSNRAKRASGAAALVATVLLVFVSAILLSLRAADAPEMRLAMRLPRPRPVPTNSTREVEAPRTAADRADASLDRKGYTLASAGALFVPSSFRSEDGAFDLLIHFHGNAELVAESASLAGLDALVLVVNLGIGSAVYENHYVPPVMMLDFDINRVIEVARSRGLREPRLRRLAFSAWSAGYAAIVRLVGDGKVRDRVSAVLLCDALHSNFSDDRTRAVDMDRIGPIVDFARLASEGRKLFVMTHSEVNEFRYATTTETSSALLSALGIYRDRKTDWPDRPELSLARSVMSTERWLEQHTDARKGDLHVAGYRGFREDDHIAHLAQMSKTVLPELVAYWKKN